MRAAERGREDSLALSTAGSCLAQVTQELDAGIMLIDRAFHGLKEHTERDVRARLGPDRWGRAHAAGRKLSIDALLEEIDRAVNS